MKLRCLLALHLAAENHASCNLSFTNRKGDGGNFGFIYLISGAWRSALSISEGAEPDRLRYIEDSSRTGTRYVLGLGDRCSKMSNSFCGRLLVLRLVDYLPRCGLYRPNL